MRHQFAVAKERRARARAERQHELDAVAFDRGEPLHFGVVDHAHGQVAEALRRSCRRAECRASFRCRSAAPSARGCCARRRESRSRYASAAASTSGATSSTSASTSWSGVHGCGVATRRRSVFICAVRADDRRLQARSADVDRQNPLGTRFRRLLSLCSCVCSRCCPPCLLSLSFLRVSIKRPPCAAVGARATRPLPPDLRCRPHSHARRSAPSFGCSTGSTAAHAVSMLSARWNSVSSPSMQSYSSVS